MSKAQDISDGYRSDAESSTCDDRNMDFGITTQNRFSQFENGGESDSQWIKTRERGSKRKKISSGSISSEKFSNLNTSDKLNNMFETMNRNADVLLSVETKQCQCLEDMQSIKANMKKTNIRLDAVEKQIDLQTEKLRMLSYKSLDLEARSRRNNLIFWGISENIRHDCKSIIFNFLVDELNLDTSNMCIERAHRLGSMRHSTQSRGFNIKRPIIVRFSDYNDTEYILRNAYKLKNTVFGIDRDYPHEIAQARRELYKSQPAQHARKHGVKCQIKYPAVLFIDGKYVENMFPDWFDVLKGSRVTGFNKIAQTSVVREHHSHENREPQNDMRLNHSIFSAKTDIDSPVPNEVFTTPNRRPSEPTTTGSNNIKVNPHEGIQM